MTKEEEAIKTISKMLSVTDLTVRSNMTAKMVEACRMAIKALKQEPCEDCISRQAVEEMIKAELPERGMWEIEGDKEKETICEVCVDLMEELSKLPSVNPQQKTEWIPVSEELPKPQSSGDDDFSDWVQITLHIGEDNDIVCRAYYCFSEKKWYADTFMVGEVTAWQPLPEPYDTESEDRE